MQRNVNHVFIRHAMSYSQLSFLFFLLLSLYNASSFLSQTLISSKVNSFVMDKRIHRVGIHFILIKHYLDISHIDVDIY